MNDYDRMNEQYRRMYYAYQKNVQDSKRSRKNYKKRNGVYVDLKKFKTFVIGAAVSVSLLTAGISAKAYSIGVEKGREAEAIEWVQEVYHDSPKDIIRAFQAITSKAVEDKKHRIINGTDRYWVDNHSVAHDMNVYMDDMKMIGNEDLKDVYLLTSLKVIPNRMWDPTLENTNYVFGYIDPQYKYNANSISEYLNIFGLNSIDDINEELLENMIIEQVRIHGIGGLENGSSNISIR